MCATCYPQPSLSIVWLPLGVGSASLRPESNRYSRASSKTTLVLFIHPKWRNCSISNLLANCNSMQENLVHTVAMRCKNQKTRFSDMYVWSWGLRFTSGAFVDLQSVSGSTKWPYYSMGSFRKSPLFRFQKRTLFHSCPTQTKGDSDALDRHWKVDNIT